MMGYWQGRDGPSTFRVDNPDGDIRLRQIKTDRFRLETEIRFEGETGLEDRVASGQLSATALDEAREVGPHTLGDTDLASVPLALRWFVTPYGLHTPAALIHDRLIGKRKPPLDEFTDEMADDYFRFMLADVGLPRVRRWLMWSAVVFGTRLRRRNRVQWSLWVWITLSLLGMVAFAIAAYQLWIFPLLVLLLLPIPAAALWGRQYRAGLIAGYLAPFALLPTAFGAIAHVIYNILEWIISLAQRLLGKQADSPIGYREY